MNLLDYYEESGDESLRLVINNFMRAVGRAGRPFLHTSYDLRSLSQGRELARLILLKPLVDGVPVMIEILYALYLCIGETKCRDEVHYGTRILRFRSVGSSLGRSTTRQTNLHHHFEILRILRELASLHLYHVLRECPINKRRVLIVQDTPTGNPQVYVPYYMRYAAHEVRFLGDVGIPHRFSQVGMSKPVAHSKICIMQETSVIFFVENGLKLSANPSRYSFCRCLNVKTSSRGSPLSALVKYLPFMIPPTLFVYIITFEKAHQLFVRYIFYMRNQFTTLQETVNAATLKSVEFDEYSIVDEYLSEPNETVEVSSHEPDITVAQNKWFGPPPPCLFFTALGPSSISRPVVRSARFHAIKPS
ncbi:hypothetical protein Syun_004183 [Stephania yunnanensis]|uniref:Uncharacterized protein n=1 Tax=Stephania yunnanensis TaxID=152371 RepID=A0AAP0L2N3_9MAGN